MKMFLNQTFGGVVKQLESVVYVIVIIGVFLEILIAVLFLRVRLAKDLSEIAVLKALGFSENDIKEQYLVKMGIASLA